MHAPTSVKLQRHPRGVMLSSLGVRRSPRAFGGQFMVYGQTRNANTQAPQRQPPKFRGAKGNKEYVYKSSKDYVQEHDYSVTPSSYTYTAEDNMEQFERFPLVSAKALAKRSERPKRVRMLSRDFIDDSMYNPTYGYFSKTAEIFSPDKPFDFQNLNNMEQFLDKWSSEYKKQAMKPDKASAGDPNISEQHKPRVTRQLWHTPTELFHPYYGRALARYCVNKVREDGDNELIIYETGAGNGTLMNDILDYLRDEEPELYKNTTYNVIEISASLALTQRAQASGHSGKFKVLNKSIFEWNETRSEKCIFIALEVWDNLAHDVIRYDNTTNEPYQGYSVVDANGDFTEIFTKKLDKWAKKFLELRSQIQNPAFRPRKELGSFPLAQPSFVRYLRNAIIPLKGNLSPPEFIPTRQLEMMYVLKEFFPNHHLLASDFTHFGERIPGYCSPVVQTFMDGQPVPISTYMALQGYFDIMFPTDFRLAQQLYELVCQKSAHVAPHGQFLKPFAELKATKTKSGESPMLSFYQNAAFMYS